MARWLLIAAFAVLSLPAYAADVVYPAGSRVGLVPPPGLSVSQSFSGFEDRTNRVAIVLAAAPAAAYGDIAGSTAPEILQKQGVTVEKREELSLPLGKALLVIGRLEIEGVPLRKWIVVMQTGDVTALATAQVPDAAQSVYSEEAIRSALTSVSVRPTVPVEEQLSLLPFRMTDLAGFKVGGVIPGRAIMLTDASAENPSSHIDTHLVVAVAPGGPSQVSERDNFARDVFLGIPNLKDVKINSSESLRIAGQQGHQIMATGKDASSGDDITIVQWLRFGGGAYLHLIGVAPTQAWTPAYGRFRQVRDGIELR